MVIEQQVDGEIDAQVGRGVWQGGAGVLWSVGGGVCYHVGDSKGSQPPPKRMNFRKSWLLGHLWTGEVVIEMMDL